eukprot:CCRYP_000823-RA/>CCRYP_000823-RA protein AED:0.02 eAED:0.02 QI:0/-1/0/1/-1/1/1/0/760
MGSPALSTPFRHKSIERSSAGSPAQLHRARNGGYVIKKVSSTGDMNDERAAAVGMERRWHKRRNKSRIENRWDSSEEDEDTETDARGSNASGTADTVTSLTSMESTERTHGSKKVVLLKTNRKSTVASSVQREKASKEKMPSPSHPIPRSSKWAQSLHAMAASAAADQISLSSRHKDHLDVTGFASSDKITPHEMPYSQNQTNGSEWHRKDRARQHRYKKKSKPSSLARLDESRTSVDDNVRTSLPKPQLKRIHTAPSPMQSNRSSVVDDALMNRALSIREDLRQYEMQELAAEAEKAAESGMERFVGSASKFTMEVTPPPKQLVRDRYDDDFVLAYQLETPLARKSNYLRPSYAMEYTPSYFNKKKIRVTALREFSEVVPSFMEMHDNIRIHLGQKGVDQKILPDEEQHRLFRKSTSQDVNDDDLNSQANASQAGSIVSFSSFAVASLRGIVDYYGSNRSKGLNDNTNSTAKLPPSNPKIDEHDRSGASKQTSHAAFDSCCGSFEFEQAAAVGKRVPATQSSANLSFEKSSTVNTDSDDSSIELYGRRDIDGRSSPSSVNGVLSGLGRDDKVLRRRELFVDGTFDEDKSRAPSMLSPSVMSNDTTQSVAKFFSRIQHKFSRSLDDSKKTSKEVEENEKFIANYFYTNQDANIVNSEGISNFKLDINPDGRRNDGFCISGCVQNDLLSSCETVGKMMDMIFSWFSEKGDCDQSAHSKSIDPKSPHIVLHQSWIRTWQTESNHRRFFMPPRLAVKHYRYSS